jgi:hypothetical protein
LFAFVEFLEDKAKWKKVPPAHAQPMKGDNILSQWGDTSYYGAISIAN